MSGFKGVIGTFCLAVLLGIALGGGQASAAPDRFTQMKPSLRVSIHEQRAFVPGELLVRFRPGVGRSERAAVVAAQGAAIEKMLSLRRLALVRLGAGASVRAVAAALSRRPEVEYAEPNFIRRLAGLPNDPRLGSQWGLRASLDADIDAPEAWNHVAGNAAKVVVAVIDSGVAYGHADLAANVWTNAGEIDGNGVDDDANGFIDDKFGWDFVQNDNTPLDFNGHGTHVAGTIGAVVNNALGVAGAGGSNVQVMAVRAADAYGGLSDSSLIGAIDYACSEGAAVINGSWGGEEHSSALRDAIAACPQGLFVFAAGNGGADGRGDNNDLFPIYPCNDDLLNIVCVAATGTTDALTRFSNFGATSVDIAAPGASIVSTTPLFESLYTDNFSLSLAGRWQAGRTAGSLWSRTSEAYNSPYFSIADSPGADYANNADTWIRNAAPFDFTARYGCGVFYAVAFFVEEGFDYLLVDASPDASTWGNVWAYTGYFGGGWTFEDFSPWDGQPTFYMRYRLVSDPIVTDDGAYVDDVDVECLSADPAAQSYGSNSGTSMAAPHVSAVAALVWAANPGWLAPAVKAQILATVDVKTGLVGKTVTGGRLNAFKAVGGVLPKIRIGDASVYEPDFGTRKLRFPVTLSAPSEHEVTVSYATANGTARAGYDYKAVRGRLVFSPGVTKMYVYVTVYGDRTRELTETLLVNLTWPLHGDFYDRRAVGRIRNED